MNAPRRVWMAHPQRCVHGAWTCFVVSETFDGGYVEYSVGHFRGDIDALVEQMRKDRVQICLLSRGGIA